MKIPVSPPDISTVVSATVEQGGLDRLERLLGQSRLGPAPEGKYRHWDTFRHVTPPGGYTVEEAWVGVKWARRALYQELPLLDTKGKPFRYALVSPLLEMLHRIDRDASGNVEGSEQVANPATRETYLFKSLIEEAITSSQLEGASTTRKVAKAMIQEGREPRTIGERMILNNFNAMAFARSIQDQPLTPDLVFHIQRLVTEGTLDDPDAAGRFRRRDEEIVLEDETGTRLHTPPPADELTDRMSIMCQFANGRDDVDGQESGGFMPPVVRAILVHFWLAYDHPFVDGNGRTARALFYWAMARDGYWLCEYVSISRILKKARGKYSRAFLYTETDDNDVTYFVLFQARVLLQAIADLQKYLQRKADEIRQAETLTEHLRGLQHPLNPRQLALLNHALKNERARYTVDSHKRSHGISYETARSDLLALAKVGIITKRKIGRAFAFDVAPDLRERLLKPGPRR
jgi:Fic family protein